jgi:hypothetical protein
VGEITRNRLLRKIVWKFTLEVRATAR